MSESPEEKTRRIPAGRPREPRLDPATPPPPGVPARTWEEELLARIDGLRTWLAIVGAIALIALAAGVYAIVDANSDDDNTSNGVSTARFSDLEDEVDSLSENQVSDQDLSDVKSDLSSLEDRVQKLEDAGSSSGDDTSSPGTQQLQRQLDELTQKLSELEDQTP